MKQRKAFTLVELLVVIAIIALLMSILMPALARVRKQAKNVLCQSSLHQWALIFTMYIQDNDGYYHKEMMGLSQGWVAALRPYYSGHNQTTTAGESSAERDIRLCPAGTKFWWDEAHTWTGSFGGSDSAWGIFSGGSDDQGAGWAYPGDCGSYGLNGWVCNDGEESAEWHPGFEPANTWRSPSVKGGGRIPVFTCAAWVDGWPKPIDQPPAIEGEIGTYIYEAMKQFCVNRHNGYINGLFVDNSARQVGLKELWTLKWHRFFKTDGEWTTAGGVTPIDWPEWMRGFKEY
jgi:prepilin-type N-terminal cleavage/methylation domain-containing protein/prepilin-type processing-associated H-X9-DG protein